MKKEQIESKVQLHICNHERDEKESCAEKGARELTKSLKKWAKEHHKGEIKVFRGGCLGKCSEGIAMACYPKNEFWLNAEVDDEEKLKEDLEEVLRQVKNSRN